MQNKRSSRMQRSILWSLFWLGISLVTALIIWIAIPNGGEHAVQFLAGYLIEESLSVDNLFVFLMLFSYFKISAHTQHRVLNFGIIGVIVLRGIMIFAGIKLLNEFEFLMYIFGAIVLYSAFKLFFGTDKEFDAEKSIVIKWTRKIIRITPEYHGEKFFIRQAGKLVATPLFVVLVVVEFTDFLFAFDSIPAIFAVTRNPLIIYGSNILAVLGLRSMYFLLEEMRTGFRFVEKGVSIILLFVGLKMVVPLFVKGFDVSTLVSLIVILSILLISILASLMIPVKESIK
jgi:tellurite resistance protein TerC